MLSLAVDCAIPSRAGAQLTSQTSYMGILVMPVSALAALTKQSIQKNLHQRTDFRSEPILDGSRVTEMPLASMILSFSSAVP
jgi:hypothetical protein